MKHLTAVFVLLLALVLFRFLAGCHDRGVEVFPELTPTPPLPPPHSVPRFTATVVGENIISLTWEYRGVGVQSFRLLRTSYPIPSPGTISLIKSGWTEVNPAIPPLATAYTDTFPRPPGSRTWKVSYILTTENWQEWLAISNEVEMR